MTEHTLEQRRKYVEQVRSSFENRNRSMEYTDAFERKESNPDQDRPVFSGGSFRLRLLLSVLIFGAFIYCSQNEIRMGNYTTKDISSYLTENIQLKKLVDNLSVPW